MGQRTAHTFTCDRCGDSETHERLLYPVDWRVVQVTLTPKGAGSAPQQMICGPCSRQLNSFMRGSRLLVREGAVAAVRRQLATRQEGGTGAVDLTP